MSMLDDVRRAVRSLLQSPGYTCAVVATLALTIGANSAIFSVVYAVLLRPLPIHEPDGLVVGWASDPQRSLPVVELSYANVQAVAARGHSFSHVAAMGSSTWPARLDDDAQSERVWETGVSTAFFETLGVSPELGRTFRADDDRPHAPRVAILSHALWVTHFGGSASIVGGTVRLPEPTTIVGVMPAGFDFPRGTDFWAPVVPILAESSGEWHADGLTAVGALFMVGRLRSGVTSQAAREDVDRIAADDARTSGNHRFGSAAVVTPLLTFVFGPVRQALWSLLAAVVVLLLVGCANISGLMLTRAAGRAHERAVRVALGATAGSLARYWLLEAFVLSIAGGAMGLVLSTWMLRAIAALAPDDVPRLGDAAINAPVAAFTFAAVAAAGLLCAAGPARHATVINVLESLNDSGRSTPGTRAHRARGLLLGGQVALSIVLLFAAGLVVRSFLNLTHADLGFTPSRVVTVSVAPRARSANAWMQMLIDRVGTLPGVEAAGAVYLRPLALGPIGQEAMVLLDGQPDRARQDNPVVNYQVATPGYFPAMKIPLERGRVFEGRDTAASVRVAVVSESAARRLWPGQDPIGKRLSMPTFSPDKTGDAWRTIVGVVGDVRYRGLGDVRLDVYDAALQADTIATDLVVRASGDEPQLLSAVEREIRRMDAHAVVERRTTMEDVVSRATAPWRFGASMFIVFAAASLILTSLGLFSLVSLGVTERRGEFAVRLALGARQRDLVGPLLWETGKRTAAGFAAGAIASLGAGRIVGGLLFGVGALDPITCGAVVGVVIAVVVVAAYVPARRAADADPLTLLRRG
jgi:putative ABC transport system permease protein